MERTFWLLFFQVLLRYSQRMILYHFCFFGTYCGFLTCGQYLRRRWLFFYFLLFIGMWFMFSSLSSTLAIICFRCSMSTWSTLEWGSWASLNLSVVYQPIYFCVSFDFCFMNVAPYNFINVLNCIIFIVHFSLVNSNFPFLSL